MFFNRATLVTLLLSLFALVSHPVQAIQNTDFLNDPEHLFWFDINDLPTMRLTFTEEQWAILLTSEQRYRPEVSGTMRYIKNNQAYVLNNIGIKLSGNTSFVLPEYPEDLYVQANFTLDFDAFVDDQELGGIGKLKLKRFKDDSTYVHEPLTNQIMLNYGVFTAHSSTYARLELKVGERDTVYYGIYRMNESVNRKEYLDKRFGTDNDGGGLWQAGYGDTGIAHLSRITPDWEGIGESDRFSFEYKGKGSKYEEAKAQLIEVAQNLTNLEDQAFIDYVDNHVNVTLFLKVLASEAVLGHWDGFWGNGNNYFIYIDESDVLHLIPYDTDNTLGTSLLVDDSGEQDPLNYALPSNAPLLVSKIMAVDKYVEEYKTHIETLVTQTDLLDETHSRHWIGNIHQLIRDDLVNVTGDNQQIADRPAWWGNQHDYRIFDITTGKNWYQTKREVVLKAVESHYPIYPTVYYRGVTNGWGASLMEQVAPNTWEITVDSDEATNSSGEPRFKFDLYGDWSRNFGDNDQDGIGDPNGSDIPFTEGFGKYRISFNAIDDSYVTLKRLPPVADAGLDITALEGSMVQFDASASQDPDGEIIEYQWSNGLTGVTPTMVYNHSGTYIIELVVTDNEEQTASDTVTVTIQAASSGNDDSTTSSGSGSSERLLILLLISVVFLRKTRRL
jgi:hypothetical protein